MKRPILGLLVICSCAEQAPTSFGDQRNGQRGGGTPVLSDLGGASISAPNTFSKSQNVSSVALTASSHAYATDSTLSNVFTLTLENAQADTLSNPTGLVAGGTYIWEVTQSGTGASTLAYGALFTWGSGTLPTITATLGAVDMVTCLYDGAKLRCLWQGAFA